MVYKFSKEEFVKLSNEFNEKCPKHAVHFRVQDPEHLMYYVESALKRVQTFDDKMGEQTNLRIAKLRMDPEYKKLWKEYMELQEAGKDEEKHAVYRKMYFYVDKYALKLDDFNKRYVAAGKAEGIAECYCVRLARNQESVFRKGLMLQGRYVDWANEADNLLNSVFFQKDGYAHIAVDGYGEIWIDMPMVGAVKLAPHDAFTRAEYDAIKHYLENKDIQTNALMKYKEIGVVEPFFRPVGVGIFKDDECGLKAVISINAAALEVQEEVQEEKETKTMKPDFNYIPAEEREAVLKKIADDPNAPGVRELMNDEVASEIWDDTKDMTETEKFDYLRKRLAREEQVMKQLQKQYEAAVKAAEKK